MNDWYTGRRLRIKRSKLLSQFICFFVSSSICVMVFTCRTGLTLYSFSNSLSLFPSSSTAPPRFLRRRSALDLPPIYSYYFRLSNSFSIHSWYLASDSSPALNCIYVLKIDSRKANVLIALYIGSRSTPFFSWQRHVRYSVYRKERGHQHLI